MKFEWCVHNEKFGTKNALRQLTNHHLADKPVTTKRYACLEYCANCCREPFVLADNTLLTAANAQQLLQKMHAQLEQGRNTE